MAISIDRLQTMLAMTEVALALDDAVVENHGAYIVERLRFRAPDGTGIRGFVTRPSDIEVPRPAILYAHAHGDKYDIGASELIDGRPALLDPPGPALAREGYVTLCIDMPTFGARSDVTEAAATKAMSWYGGTLFGRMLSEQRSALAYLAARSDVDASRIAMTGISMGATLAYFLAAVDTRITTIAHLCCYADFATLIETGAHDLHGHYLTVPGLLAETSTGEIAGLVAPRPQLICVGTDDPLTPLLAVQRAYAQTRRAYEAAGAPGALLLIEEAGVGHCETVAMRRAVLAFLEKHLR